MSPDNIVDFGGILGDVLHVFFVLSLFASLKMRKKLSGVVWLDVLPLNYLSPPAARIKSLFNSATHFQSWPIKKNK